MDKDLYHELGTLTKRKEDWKDNIPFVGSLLENQSTRIMAKALWLLGEMGLQYPKEIEPYVASIATFLDSQDDLLRERSLNALGRIGRTRVAVDVPHGAIGEGGDFHRDNIIVGKQKRWSQQHWGFQVVDEHLTAFLTHHSCLGLTFDKHHQRTTWVTWVEHPPSSGIILSATRAFEQTLQGFVAASCKEFDTFQFFHDSIFSAQKYGKKCLM